MEQHVSLILAVLSLVSTAICIVTFFNKLKWTQELHEKKFVELKQDIDGVGSKLSGLTLVQQSDVKDLFVKIDAIDKAVIGITVSLGYIKDVVQELKGR